MDDDVKCLLQSALDFWDDDPVRWWGGYPPRQRSIPSRCLYQAIDFAARYDLKLLNSLDARDRTIAALGFKSMHGMTSWNDSPGRTFEEVRGRVEEALRDV
jgi:hypothetical protein